MVILIAGAFLDMKAQQPNRDSTKVIGRSGFLSLLVTPDEVEGRLNLYSNWQEAEVFLSNGRFASDIIFNYDLMNNTILILVDQEEYALNPIAVDSILMEGRSEVLVNPIILEGLDGDMLLLRIFEGRYLSLFRTTSAKEVVDYEPTTVTRLVYHNNVEIEIDQKQKYLLLKKATNEYQELQGNKKDFKKWENGAEILDYVKDQELNLNYESGLIGAVDYYDQLLQDAN